MVIKDENELNKPQEPTYSESEEVLKQKKAKEELKQQEEALHQEAPAQAEAILSQMGELGSNPTAVKDDLAPGYIPIELSTKGMYGAPKLFHVRDFDLGDLTNLALSEQEDLPVKMCKMLNNLILEKDVNVAFFHNGEVIELIIIMFRSFFSRYFKGIRYTPTEQDLKFQQQELGGEKSEEYQEWLRLVKTGKIELKFDIDIDSLQFYKIDSNSKTRVRAKNDTIDAVFTYPTYGDLAILKQFIDAAFKEEDKQYARNMEVLQLRQEAKNKLLEGENISLKNIPNIPKAELERMKNYYEEKKGLVMIEAIKALHLAELDGKDVRKLSLGERIKLIKNDARFTYDLMNQVEEFFRKNVRVGVDVDKLEYTNPVTQERERADPTFRDQLLSVDNLLLAYRNSRSNKTTFTAE